MQRELHSKFLAGIVTFAKNLEIFKPDFSLF